MGDEARFASPSGCRELATSMSCDLPELPSTSGFKATLTGEVAAGGSLPATMGAAVDSGGAIGPAYTVGGTGPISIGEGAGSGSGPEGAGGGGESTIWI